MQLSQDFLHRSGLTCALLVLGGFGGFIASKLSVPMPWMLGALMASAGLVLVRPPLVLNEYSFPTGLRSGFVGLIGVMIGAQVTPDLVTVLPEMPLTIAALALFVGLCFAGNLVIFERLGGYDRATAFFSGTPGGLLESIVMGEESGADIRILTTQQFLRVIAVIALVPLGLSLWLGHPVGSAAGLSAALPDHPVTVQSLALVIAAALTGFAMAKKLRLPAGQLTGPLLLTAALNLSGIVDIHLPSWMVAAAQLVIGVSLGLRFQGVDGALLRRSLWLCMISVSYMLGLGLCFAFALHQFTQIEFLHLFISFAPGGVAEMSIIALSLAANPALVSLIHVIRILMTVAAMPLIGRWMKLR